MSDLTQQRLKELLTYDPETGLFARRASGRPAGHVAQGRRRIFVEGRTYLASRLAVLYMTGENPPVVDHASGDCGDDRWANLRVATRAQNSHNAKLHRDSSSGFKNVSREPGCSTYKVQMMARGRPHRVCGFKTPELAAEFAGLMRETLHGQFARHA